MRSRQDIIELFSSFLQFEADRANGWVIDGRLRRNIRNYQGTLTEAEPSHNYWVVYWYKLWSHQPEGLAKGHLSAYLQEACYWAAQKTITSITTTQYTLSDCFQMAIARVDKVLKGFKPEVGFSLSSYASAIFSSELKEMLRQQKEIDICTNWRLLRKITQKRLVESLENAGLRATEIANYVLAWKCFNSCYIPQQPKGTRKLPKPDDATWDAIAKMYNSQLHSLPNPVAESSKETMEKWLVATAKATRAYLYPSFTSLNAPRGDENSAEFIDNLADNLPGLKQESLLSEFIAEEEQNDRQAQLKNMGNILAVAINELDSETQQIFQLYYAEELTQQQIAKQLEIKQYTISRRLTKARETLLIKLANWSRDTLHISLNSTVLNYISTVMEEWLKSFYTRPLTPQE
ncbi:sigma-70 family RNA polymerase sigma factor [Brunnivagina elsteri]|uniref:Group 3/4 sigma-70 RNA polymerase sigma factor n=1 Tax=Brunnivagina elsteri CCALA 953 TaxID=987040 RepID=A0A2A2TAK6_9CYAN|nr:sigma-70 family RNA polymerase sigma factor [Calothrix elsteri]PAX47615.1 group 3/4 sigma-70 RNA polymerase sigma factor [Calothrix elsteri CCALA 953]